MKGGGLCRLAKGLPGPYQGPLAVSPLSVALSPLWLETTSPYFLQTQDRQTLTEGIHRIAS